MKNYLPIILISIMASCRLDAQPNRPYVPDLNTIGLWHCDITLPDSQTSFAFSENRNFGFQDAIPLNDGGYFVLTSRHRDGNEPRSDPMVSKLSENCQLIWSKIYQTQRQGGGLCRMLQTDDGNVHCIGYDSFRNLDGLNRSRFWLLTLDENGDSVKSSYYPIEGIVTRGLTMLKIEDGLILCGWARIDDDQGDWQRLRLIRLRERQGNDYGEVVWDRTYNNNIDFSPTNIYLTNDNSILIVGTDENDGGNPNQVAFATKIDMEGNEVWFNSIRERFGGEDVIGTCDGVIPRDGGYLLYGQGTQQFQNENGDVYLDDLPRFIYINEEGEEQWRRYVESPLPIRNFCGVNNGSYVFSGGTFQLGICQFSEQLELEWQVGFRAPTWQKWLPIFPKESGGFILFGRGHLEGDHDYQDIYVISTSSATSSFADNSGHGNNLIPLGHILCTEGKWEGGLEFPSDTITYLLLTNGVDLQPEELTIELWFKILSREFEFSSLVTKHIDERNHSYHLIVDNFESCLFWQVKTDSGSFEVRCEVNLENDDWHHVLVAHNGLQAWQIIDGDLDGAGFGVIQAPGNINYSELPITIGNSPLADRLDTQFIGVVDEIRISDRARFVPNRIRLEQSEFLIPHRTTLSAFPNPFNSSTTISFSLPASGWTTMDVTDVNGRLVQRLSSGWREAGSYSTVWNGAGLSSGEYIVKLKSDKETTSTPIILVK